MKIYYWTKTDSHIEELKEYAIVPKRFGSIGEHLAYAIFSAEKFANKIHSNRISKILLNKAIKKVFVRCMNESVLTRNLLTQIPVFDFDFTIRDLITELAKLFILNNPASEIVVDERVELHIPECPVYLAPIKYGVKFLNDPNWYDIYAAHQTIFLTHANQNPLSPCTNQIWLGIQDCHKFTTDRTANEVAFDLEALSRLHEIAERLRVVYALIPRDYVVLRQALPQPAIEPVNFDPDLPLPANPFQFGIGLRTMLQFLQQNHNPGMVPDIFNLVNVGANSTMSILSAIEVLKILGVHRNNSILFDALIALSVIPTFLISYQINSVGIRTFLTIVSGLSSPERNNRPQQSGFFSELSQRLLSGFFTQAPRADNALEQEFNRWNVEMEQPIIIDEIRNNPPQRHNSSFSHLLQRLGFLAPSAEVQEAVQGQNPYNEGRDIARRAFR